MMVSWILKFADLQITQKPKYFENETFFLQMKKIIHYNLKGHNVLKIVF